MKRIDTINARPNVNGVGKTGFSDNSDLPGQDATYVSPEWLNVIQEELCNLLEMNGIALNSGVRDQLYQLLATNADIDALAVATQVKLDQEQSWRENADNWLQQQINNEQAARQNADADLEDRKFNKTGGTIENSLFVNKSIVLSEGLYFQYPYDPVTSLTNIILEGNFNTTTGKWQFDFKTEYNLDRFTFDKSIECVGSFVTRDSNNHSIYSSMFPKVLENSTIFDTSLAAFRFTKPIIAPNLNPIGVGQTWQDVTASRAIGTEYTNDTGQPIDVKISVEGGSIRNKVYVDDVLISDLMSTYNTGGPIVGSSFIVPAESTYKIDAPGGILHVWAELR